MTAPALPNDQPIEVMPPDIRRWAEGNTGIPYLWSFTAEPSGPHVLLAAIVHGNEPCGAVVLDRLLKEELRPRRGRLTLAFMNHAAYAQFDPADPFATRWLEEDLNRVWSSDVLEGRRSSLELRRAREVRPMLDTVDLLLDLHSMTHATEPLTLCGPCERGAALARALGVPRLIVSDAGHASGVRMRDYEGFGNAQGSAAALLIECGQHWAASSVTMAWAATRRFLEHAGQLEAAPCEVTAPQLHVEVTEAITVRAEPFEFTRDFKGGEIIPARGTVIAYDGGVPIATRYDDCVLIMPSRRLSPGLTAVRLGRVLDPPPRGRAGAGSLC